MYVDLRGSTWSAVKVKRSKEMEQNISSLTIYIFIVIRLWSEIPRKPETPSKYEDSTKTRPRNPQKHSTLREPDSSRGEHGSMRAGEP